MTLKIYLCMIWIIQITMALTFAYNIFITWLITWFSNCPGISLQRLVINYLFQRLILEMAYWIIIIAAPYVYWFYIMHIIWSWPNLLQCDNCIFVLILHFKGAALCNDSFSLQLQVDHNEYFCATAIFFIAADCHLHYKYELCGGYFTQLIFTLNIVRNTFSSLS